MRPPTRGRRRAWVLTAACAAALAAGRQPPQSLPQQPTYRAGTTLVEVDAIVTDRDGRFVADLTPADFEVLEDGKPQQVETLYVVVNGHARALPTPSAAAAGPALAGSAPDTGRVFVLFFDLGHMWPNAVQRAQAAARGFLEQNFRPGDFGGVVGPAGMANNRLTSSREELLAAVDAISPDISAAARRGEPTRR